MQTRVTPAQRFVAGLFSMCACGIACHSDAASSAGESPATAALAAPAQASAPAQLSLVTPTLGGSVVGVGDRQVELAILENGQVQALVYDAQGKVLAASEQPQVSVALRTRGGGHPSARLAWDAPHACLQGRAQLEAGLIAEPVDVALELDGKRSTATLASYAILPFARFGGSVLGVGPYAVELVTQPDLMLAYALDASGKALSGGDLALQLQLGPAAPLELKWEPQRGYYSAALDGKLDASAQPLRLALTAQGKSFVGAALSLKALAVARVDARAQLAPGASAQIAAAAPQLAASVKAGAAARPTAQAKARVKLAAPRLPAPSAKLDVKKSVSARSTSTSSKAKAGAGVKASASFGFGK